MTNISGSKSDDKLELSFDDDVDAFAGVDFTKIDSVFQESQQSLNALALAAGEDPQTFYIGRNFIGSSLEGIDVSNVCLDEADLRGTGLRLALIDMSTSLKKAILDVEDKSYLIERGILVPKLPTDFNFYEVHKMILRGETPPNSWWPWITELDFSVKEFKNFENIAIFTLFANLEHIDLEGTRVKDITVLSGLAKLTHLYLGHTRVSDISALSVLVNLTNLDLACTHVRDITALSKLVNLKQLDLGGTQVSDLSAMSEFVNLVYLNLWATRVNDIAALSGLLNLKKLVLWDTEVKDISALSQLLNLEQLDLWHTKVKDISALSQLVNLKQLALGGTQVKDISALSQLVNLTQIDLGGAKFKDISVLNRLPNLQNVFVEKSRIKTLAPTFNRTGIIKSYDLVGQLQLDKAISVNKYS